MKCISEIYESNMWQEFIMYSTISDVCIIVIIYHVKMTFESWYNMCSILICLTIKYV